MGSGRNSLPPTLQNGLISTSPLSDGSQPLAAASLRLPDSEFALCCGKKQGLDKLILISRVACPEIRFQQPPPFSGKLPEPDRLGESELLHISGQEVESRWEAGNLTAFPFQHWREEAQFSAARRWLPLPSERAPAPRSAARPRSPPLARSLEGKVRGAGHGLG